MKKTKEIVTEMKRQGYNIKLASEMEIGKKIRTGVFALDYVLDGGIYQGEGGHRIELYGNENSGKTTFTLYLIKKFQELKKSCIFINGENSYDPNWASALGVDNKKLYIVKPDNLEQAGDMLTDFIGKYELIVMDSIPAIITMEEQEGTMDDKYYASQSKVYSPMMRKLYAATKEFSPTIVMINQVREKIGVSFGNPQVTPGGKALKHFYNTRVEFRTGQMIKAKPDKDMSEEEKKKAEIIGHEMFLNCSKNKRGKPHRVIALDFYLNGYVDNRKSLFFAGLKYGVIQRQGNSYIFGEKTEVGQDRFMESLDDKTLKEIEDEIWKKI